MDKKILFSCNNISKDFSGMRALDGVNMAIRAGEIVGLIGENGAGKSTLLKIIMGFQPQTKGEMTVGGAKFAPSSTREANQRGIGMVYQEQSLVTNLTVSQNIFFGFEKRFTKFGCVNWREMNRRAKEILEEAGSGDIDPEKKVIELNFATRQMVEIAKVFNSVRMSDADKYLILLDEPTSLLNDEEIQILFRQMRRLKEEGHSIIFVSHRLDEVLELTDRIYIFKDGKCVGETETRRADEAKLYEMMVGRSTTGEYYKIERQSDAGDKLVMQVEGLGLEGFFKDVSFKLYKGAALGICGVVGSGKEELCSVLLGDERPTRGKIRIDGKERNFSSPHKALMNGIGTIPKERRVEGIVGIRSVGENIVLSSLSRLAPKGYLSPRVIQKIGEAWIKRLSIKCTGVEAPVQSLSGGNAQKVVFARALESKCRVLILNHPTRGVDVGAKEEIYSLIRDVTAKGVSVIVLGDTLDECIALSSHILVMKDGVVTKEFDAPKDNKPSQVDIVRNMM